MVALVDALGEKRALIVGHDWGAPVAWHAALMRPDVFPAVVAMSVPHRRRGPLPPLDTLRKAGQVRLLLDLFPGAGVAEAEFARDAAFTLRRILYIGSGETPREHKMSLYVDRATGLPRARARSGPLPPWLSEADIACSPANIGAPAFAAGSTGIATSTATGS